MKDNIEIDWTGFDINNYPKVNPYELLNRTELLKTTGRDYPLKEAGYVFISLFLGAISRGWSYAEKPFNAFFFGIIAIVVLFIMILRRKKGLKIYKKMCMEQYKSEYIKKIELESYINSRQMAILNYTIDKKIKLSEKTIDKNNKIKSNSFVEKNVHNDKPKMNMASDWYNGLNCNLGDVLLNRNDFFSENKLQCHACLAPP